MNALLLLITALVIYGVAYRVYAKKISVFFDVNPSQKTPAFTQRDGVDFEPAKNWWVLFGHHFSSICGAGPIVGPALACAYWGWGVSFVWIVLGAVLMGAVADFSSLIMSVKEKGQSIAGISGQVVSKRAKLFFSVFLWISLILVISVFSIFASKTFIQEPEAVMPSFGLIPVAVIVGWMIYRKNMAGLWPTAVGLALLFLLLLLGRFAPIALSDGSGFLTAQNIWILILLGYCFFASVTPVQILLQPRDYLASFILFALIGIGLLGVLIVRPSMQMDPFLGFHSQTWSEAGPLIPMLFVTIACGAISGFHSLVSSGTTCKQIANESHACRIGYGGMLTESLVGILVLICVSAGLSQVELNQTLKAGGPILAFSRGYGALSKSILGDYGVTFAVLALNAFILTTLDSATRITRYLTAELFGITNKYFATALVVAASALLAVTGKWTLLWPAFGTANQLIAGITLLVASCWLLARGKNFWFTLIPSAVMLVITLYAFALQFFGAMNRAGADGLRDPNISLMVITSVLILMALSIIAESLKVFKNIKLEGGRYA